MTGKAPILVVNNDPNITKGVSMVMHYEGFEILAQATTLRTFVMVLDVIPRDSTLSTPGYVAGAPAANPGCRTLPAFGGVRAAPFLTDGDHDGGGQNTPIRGVRVIETP